MLGNLYVLTGLPASCKSTFSKHLIEQENTVVLSSDEIREELFNDVNNQNNNSQVFEVMNKRAQEFLNNGINVVMDATNINRKRRIHLIQNVLRADKKIAYYMSVRFETACSRDHNRGLDGGRTVGKEVIDRMYKTLEIPTILEGWDEVVFVHQETPFYDLHHVKVLEEKLQTENITHDWLFDWLNVVTPEFKKVFNLPQDSKYHSFSVSRHTYYVWDYILKNYRGSRKLEMLYAAVFHDLGKAHCKSFVNYKGEEKRHASFIGHEYVSAQLVCYWLNKMGYSGEFIKYVVDIVQFHMKPMNLSEKQEKKLRKLLTNEQYEDLMLFHEADCAAK